MRLLDSQNEKKDAGENFMGNGIEHLLSWLCNVMHASFLYASLSLVRCAVCMKQT